MAKGDVHVVVRGPVKSGAGRVAALLRSLCEAHGIPVEIVWPHSQHDQSSGRTLEQAISICTERGLLYPALRIHVEQLPRTTKQE